MADNNIVAVFELERETKNTVRYEESSDTAPAIGTLYVKKWAARQMGGGSYPHQIRVTVEVMEE